MKIKNTIIVLVLCFGLQARGSNYLQETLKKDVWGQVPVTWIQDDTSPTFSLALYFADGALSDGAGKNGETEFFFEQLLSGTKKIDQEKIHQELDFYGTKLDHKVYHEYSVLAMSGLLKYSVQSVKMLCTLLNEADYPESELNLSKDRVVQSTKSLVANHGQLAERIARKIFLRESPFELGVEGSIKTIPSISRDDLLAKRQYFVGKVKKRIYLVGPKNLASLKDVLVDQCRFSQADFERTKVVTYQSSPRGGRIYFAPVKDANQAQIRFGKMLGNEESKYDSDLMELASTFIGGGFTSQLIQELRVKRGLTYSASAVAANQKTYGRSGISTFSKNSSAKEAIRVVKNVLIDVGRGNIQKDELERTKQYLLGSHLLSFEANKEFMMTLMTLDHLGQPLEAIYQYPQKIKAFSSNEVTRMVRQLFRPENLDILVVGDPSLEKELKKMGQLIVVNYQDYL